MMTDTADVVVIGGGILGCATAVHLLEMGAGSVVILERDDVASGTSNAGAGFVGLWAVGYVPLWGEEEAELERYGLDFYRRLSDEGEDLGYKGNGNVWAATTAEAWEVLQPLLTHPDAAHRRSLSPEEAEELTGILSANAIAGAVFDPMGCQVHAPLAARGLGRRFEAMGGRIERRRPVTGLVLDGGRVVAVETALGRVSAGAVVLAVGAWTNVLLRTVGQRLPVVPLVASRVSTEPLGVAPMPTIMLPEFTLWVREEQGALLFGGRYQTPPRRAFVGKDPADLFDDLALDGVEEIRSRAEAASKAIPILSRVSSYSVAHGAPTYTNDARNVIGPVPGIDGLFVIAGCNEAGITHGPGMARLAAGAVVGQDKVPDVFRPDRFADEHRTEEELAASMWT